MKATRRNLLAASSCLIGFTLPAQAITVTKENNTTHINNGASWVGGALPGSADIALYDGTITGALTTSSTNNNFTQGALQVTNIGGNVALAFGGTYTLNGVTGVTNVIDLSAASADLTLGTAVNTGFLRWASGNYAGVSVASGRTLTINSNWTNQGNTKTIQLNGPGSIVLNGSSGSGGAMSFNVSGANVSLNNATNSGNGWTVASGSLTLGNTTAAQSFTVTNNAADGLRFGTGITAVTLGNLSTNSSGSFALTNSDTNAVALTLNNANGGNYTLAGAISGGGSIIKNGAGNYTLSGTNTFTGGISLNAGTLNIGSSQGGGTSANTITAANGTTIAATSGVGSGQVAAGISLSGTDANVTLTNANASGGFGSSIAGSADQTLTISQAGGQNVNLNSTGKQLQDFNGTVSIAPGNTLAFRATSLNNGSDNALFDVNGSITTRNNGFVTLGALSGSGTLSMGTSGGTNQSVTYTVGARGTNTTFSGVIQDGDTVNGKTVRLTKTGSGSLTLSNANTYTGATTVSAGTLLVTGALGATNVTVGVDGTIGGNGSLGGDLLIEAGGGLDLTGATLGLTSTGILTVDTGKTITLNDFSFADIVGWNAAGASDGTYTLINGGLDVILGGSTPTISSPFAFSGSKYGYFQEGSLQAVIYTIPEPGSVLLGGLGMLALLRRRNRC